MEKLQSLRQKTQTMADSKSYSLSRLKFNEKELAKIATGCVADKEGLVEKKGPGKGQGYKPRWLKLKGNLLFYFKISEGGGVDASGPAGLLILESCCPERAPKEDKPFGFTISFTNDKSRVYKFSAHTDQDANSWVEALRNASYETLRMRVYQLQKEISKRTGMDPLIGLASKVKKQKSSLTRSLRSKPPSGVRIFRQVDARRQLFNFSSLDAPLFELHLSCEGLPLLQNGSSPNTLVRSCVSLGLGGAVKMLSDTEIVEGSCSPVFFFVVMLEVTREATTCGIVQFEVESTGTGAFGPGPVSHDEDDDDSEDVCLLAATLCRGEIHLQKLLDYPATSDHGVQEIPMTTPEGTNGGVLTVKIRKAKEVMEYCDSNVRSRRSTIVKQVNSIQGLQLPIKNIHFCPFQFPTKQRTTLKVLEELSESVFNLQVPLQLLKCYIQEDRKLIEDIRSLGHLGLDWGSTVESFKAFLVEAISEYQMNIDAMNAVFLEGECSFKRSTEKKNKGLQFVPCNLHIQVLRVSELGGSGKSEKHTLQKTSYAVVTFGAPADHAGGFRQGGMKKLLQEARNQPSFVFGCHKHGETLDQLSKIKENIYDFKNHLLRSAANQNPSGMSEAMQGLSHSVQLLLQLLQSDVVSSAIQDLRSARASHLQTHTSKEPAVFPKCQCKFTALNDWIWNGKRLIQVSTEWEERKIIELVNQYLIALLNRVEKASQLMVELRHEAHASSVTQISRYKPTYCWSYDLLKAFGKLNQVLEGICTVVESSVCFAMIKSDTRVQGVEELRHRRDVVFSQILTALMTGFYQSLSEHLKDCHFMEQIKELGYLAHFQSFLSNHGDELSMLEDMQIAVSELKTVSFQILPRAGEDTSSVDFSIVGSRTSLIVQFLFPPSLLALIPNSDIASGHPIKVVPVLFTQGINERQTIANLTPSFNSVTKEDEINSTSLHTLQQYVSDYVQLMGEDHPKSLGVRNKLDSLQKSLSKVKTKNAEFMMEAELFCRALKGGRFTSCKSAKDRTGMAVTLEEVNLLSSYHALEEASTVTALNAIRSQGTSLYKCYKNTGKYRYAFNVLTLRTFPHVYQPPAHTCSRIIPD